MHEMFTNSLIFSKLGLKGGLDFDQSSTPFSPFLKRRVFDMPAFFIVKSLKTCYVVSD